MIASAISTRMSQRTRWVAGSGSPPDSLLGTSASAVATCRGPQRLKGRCQALLQRCLGYLELRRRSQRPSMAAQTERGLSSVMSQCATRRPTARQQGAGGQPSPTSRRTNRDRARGVQAALASVACDTKNPRCSAAPLNTRRPSSIYASDRCPEIPRGQPAVRPTATASSRTCQSAGRRPRVTDRSADHPARHTRKPPEQ